MTNDSNKLVEDNINLAYKFARKYYNSFGRAIELDDLQSVCFIGLINASRTYNKSLGFAFSTYAYQIMKNEVILYIRKINKHPTISISESIGDDITIEDLLQSDIDIQYDVENLLEIEQLYKFINELSELDQKIITYYLKGYTLRKIAKILGYSDRHISVRYRRILNILRCKFRNLSRGGEL